MDNVSRTVRDSSSPLVADPPAPTLPASGLWDMDGTIIDTEPQWLAAEVALAERHGGTWTQEMGDQLIGLALPESNRILRDSTGIDVSIDQPMREVIEEMVRLVRAGAADWRPGARELLADLVNHEVPCALVTMSYSELADVVLDMLPAGTFDVVVTGDQVRRGKPHPEPYLLAASRLGVDVD